MIVPLAHIEAVHGLDRKLRDRLQDLEAYDRVNDACTDPKIAWALMYPSPQADRLLEAMLR